MPQTAYSSLANTKWGRQKPFSPATINYSHPLARGLVSCHLLNEGGSGTGFDICALPNNLTTIVGTTSVPGAFNGLARKFNGTTDRMQHTPGVVTAPPLSMVTWFYPPALVTATLVDIGDTSVAGRIFDITIRNTGQVRLLVNSAGDGGTAVNTDATALYNVGAWNQAVGVVVGSTSRSSYVNGGNGFTNTTSAIVPSTSNSLSVGCRTINITSNFFNGIIDHVLVYNRELTAADVAWLYAEPFAFIRQPTAKRVLFDTVTSGSIVTGVGTAAGDSTCSGIGASLFLSVGTAPGTSTATAIGASLVLSVATAPGTSSASGIGASLFLSVGTAPGTSSASAIGASLVLSVASAAGSSTASGIGRSLVLSVGTAPGTSSANGLGASLFLSVGTAPGTSSASAIGASLIPGTGTGTAPGTSSANGIGASLSLSVATAAGSSTASGIGASLVLSVGTAPGTSTANAIGASLFLSVGTAPGTCSASAIGAIVGTSVWLATVTIQPRWTATTTTTTKATGTTTITPRWTATTTITA